MPEQNPARSRTERPRGCDEILRLQRKNLTPHQARETVPSGQAKYHDETGDGDVTPCGENRDEQQNSRNRQQSVEDSLKHSSSKSASVSGSSSVRSSKSHADQCCKYRDTK